MRKVCAALLVLTVAIEPLQFASATNQSRAEDCATVIGFSIAPSRYLALCANEFPTMAAIFKATASKYDARNAAAANAAMRELLDLGHARNTPNWTEESVRALMFKETDGPINATWNDAATRRLDFCSDAVKTYSASASDIRNSILEQFRSCVGYFKSLMY